MNQQISLPEIPAGYWENAKGDLVPETKVSDIDKLRDQLVRDLCAQAEARNKDLAKFKLDSMGDVTAFVETSVEQYGVKVRGTKGNFTLMTFDGKLKVVRQMQDQITFGEQLQAAKSLIDQCVTRWAEGANDNIKVLVSDAFQVDKQGLINTGRVLGLRRLDIKDEDWQTAMKAISDSIQIASTKPYIRFYKRNETTGAYDAINLDLAAV
ncbi:DUF3164 domain-containing protein [Comamonas aquatilis]|uniref:DUF3164 family protein n=1 Tax=Comamonas aquatilis TaxID=1778406 RepID=UPI0039F1102A